MKLYDLLETITRKQYFSSNRQNLHEFKPAKNQHIILVTSILAQSGLQRIMNAINPEDFTYEIRVLNIAVAAWITIDFIADNIGEYNLTDILIIPGKVIGSDDELEKMLGIKVYRGPQCYSELPMFLESKNFEVITDADIIKPKITILGTPGSHKTEIAKSLASTYEIPYISPLSLMQQGIIEKDELAIRAKEYIDRGELMPHFLSAELIRSRLMMPDAKNGFVLDGYPRTVRDIQWLDDMKSQPDVVVNIKLDQKHAIKNMRQTMSSSEINVILERFHQETQKVINYYSTNPSMINITANPHNYQSTLSDVYTRVEGLLQQCVLPDNGAAEKPKEDIRQVSFG